MPTVTDKNLSYLCAKCRKATYAARKRALEHSTKLSKVKGRMLLSEPHITISYDVLEDVLHVNWTGEQTKETVMDGSEQILYYLKLNYCSKVLNDNTHVTGMWADASEWGAVDWLPRMYKAGCKFFAWVYSPDVYSRLSTDKTLSYGVRGIIITTFESKETATAWLSVME